MAKEKGTEFSDKLDNLNISQLGQIMHNITCHLISFTLPKNLKPIMASTIVSQKFLLSFTTQKFFDTNDSHHRDAGKTGLAVSHFFCVCAWLVTLSKSMMFFVKGPHCSFHKSIQMITQSNKMLKCTGRKRKSLFWSPKYFILYT